MFRGYYESPIGFIEVLADDENVHSVLFVEEINNSNENHIVKQILLQLDFYFKGNLNEFDSPSMSSGTPFQQTVWTALTEIPFGTTTTYSDIAHLLNNEKAVRAVGTAIGKNKLAILVPCHRVVRKNGSMTGFAWGTWRKEWLLQHEKNHSPR
ncbi:MAG: methylated-DNA--[protein]-cysteine S-methyltransferase [Paenisporosarcina sp.]